MLGSEELSRSTSIVSVLLLLVTKPIKVGVAAYLMHYERSPTTS